MQNRSWQSATDDFFFAGGRPCLYFRVFIRRGLANNPSVLLKSLGRAATVRWQLTSIHRILARLHVEHTQNLGRTRSRRIGRFRWKLRAFSKARDANEAIHTSLGHGSRRFRERLGTLKK